MFVIVQHTKTLSIKEQIDNLGYVKTMNFK